MGLNMQEKQAVTREYKPRYQKASKKEKRALLDEYIKLTGYHRKSAARLLCATTVRQVMLYQDGKAIKIKPEKNRPANRTGRRVYTDEVIRCLRLVWTFFWFKCGRTKVRRYSPRCCGSRWRTSPGGRPSASPQKSRSSCKR